MGIGNYKIFYNGEHDKDNTGVFSVVNVEVDDNETNLIETTIKPKFPADISVAYKKDDDRMYVGVNNFRVEPFKNVADITLVSKIGYTMNESDNVKSFTLEDVNLDDFEKVFKPKDLEELTEDHVLYILDDFLIVIDPEIPLTTVIVNTTTECEFDQVVLDDNTCSGSIIGKSCVIEEGEPVKVELNENNYTVPQLTITNFVTNAQYKFAEDTDGKLTCEPVCEDGYEIDTGTNSCVLTVEPGLGAPCEPTGGLPSYITNLQHVYDENLNCMPKLCDEISTSDECNAEVSVYNTLNQGLSEDTVLHKNGCCVKVPAPNTST